MVFFLHLIGTNVVGIAPQPVLPGTGNDKMVTLPGPPHGLAVNVVKDAVPVSPDAAGHVAISNSTAVAGSDYVNPVDEVLHIGRIGPNARVLVGFADRGMPIGHAFYIGTGINAGNHLAHDHPREDSRAAKEDKDRGAPKFHSR